MAWKLSNFAASTLRQAITAAATTIYIDADEVDLLPTLGGGDKAKMVIFDGSYREIINVTAWNTDGTLTVERGQESTSARAWDAGTRIIHTPTAEILQNVLNATATVRYVGTATGTNAYTLNVGAGASIPSLTDGEEAAFIIPNDNTPAAAPTFVVTNGTSSTTAKPIVHQDDQTPEAGDLQGGWLAVVRYNSAYDAWVLVSDTSYQEHIERVNDGPLPAASRHPNGRFDFWNNGTSFATPASGTETADGWEVIYDGSIGAFSVARQAFTPGQTDVPGDPRYFLRWDQSAAGSGSTVRRLRVKIPGVHWRNGEQVSRGVWLKADSARTVVAKILQNFGTGGSPSSEVEADSDSLSVTTSWTFFPVTSTLPSISGKTIGSNLDDCLYLTLDLPVNVTMTIDVACDDFRPGHIAGLQSDTFPLPLWLGGTGMVAYSTSELVTLLLAGYTDLLALEALATTGLAARTGAGTWATRTVTAGTGIGVSNGDGVAGNPTISLSHLGLQNLVDPNADRVTFWDDSSGYIDWLTVGTGLAISATTLALSHLGIQSLTDPNADRVFFWDDSAGAAAWLGLGNALAIDDTTLYTIEPWMIAASDETTALTSGTGKAYFVFPYNVTVLGVGAAVNTAGTALTIDINESGTSILSTKLTIDSGEKTSLTAATPAVISDTTITAGNEISVDFDTVTGTWKGLKVWLLVRRTSA